MPVYTYQTRLNLDVAQSAALEGYARQYGQLERKLFAALSRNAALIANGRSSEVISITKLKTQFIAEHGITARHFNAMRMLLDGKIKSIQASLQPFCV